MKIKQILWLSILFGISIACSPVSNSQSISANNTSSTASSPLSDANIISRSKNQIIYVESSGVKVMVTFEDCSRNPFLKETIVSCDISWISLDGNKEIVLSPRFVSLNIDNGKISQAIVFSGVVENFSKDTKISISGSIPTSFYVSFEVPKDVMTAKSLNIDSRFKNTIFENITLASGRGNP